MSEDSQKNTDIQDKISKIEDNAYEKAASDSKLAALNKHTLAKAAVSGAVALTGVVVAASTGNIPGAVAKLAMGAYQAHSVLSGYKNVNYSNSRLISRERVEEMSKVLDDSISKDEMQKIYYEINQGFKNKKNQITQLEKVLNKEGVATSEVFNLFNKNAPQAAEHLQHAVQNLSKDKQYEVALCVTDKGRAALYVAALQKAKLERDVQEKEEKIQKEAARIAKEAFKKKSPELNSASEMIKHLNNPEYATKIQRRASYNPFKKSTVQTR